MTTAPVLQPTRNPAAIPRADQLRCKIVFGDTETTSLRRRDRRIWNIGLIGFGPDGWTEDLEIIIKDPDLTEADPYSLKLGHFWERHPQYGGTPGDGVEVVSEAEAVRQIEKFLRPTVVRAEDGTVTTEFTHLVGGVPSFDDHSFWALMQRHGQCYTVHHHLVDWETLAVGWLAGRGTFLLPPWNSEEISEALGVPLAPPQWRHTALADADWAMRMWARIYGGS